MSLASDKTEFHQLLIRLDQDVLTEPERRRLFELLDTHPQWISEFVAHCHLGEDLHELDDDLLHEHGIDLPERKLHVLPNHRDAPVEASCWRSTASKLAIGAAAAALAITTWQAIQPTAESPVEVAHATPSLRDGSLNNDDSTDEAVALSGAAAQANSRRVRGGKPEGAVSVPTSISFNQHVRPILSENCFHCHGPDAKTQKADLRLDTPEGATRDLGGYAAILPGDADKSEAWIRIISTDEDDLMPPPDSHRTLSPADKEILKRWINQGAEYQIHWAFISPQRVSFPEVANLAWSKNPIDQFVLGKLDAEGLEPAPVADPKTLIRRLSLDLIGLPPTPKESQAFVRAWQSDPDQAVRDEVARLQASPHYGERMALPWLDAARYADSNGFQQDGDRHQWLWRDWVVRAFNDNMPFDQFTVEQLAGDLLPEPSNDQLIATAFNRNHMLNGEGGAIKEEQRINNVIDRVDTTSTTWLGLTMACSQCHDHKYDPISQREYYEFFAFFNNLPESGGVDKRSTSGCTPGSKRTVQVSRPLLALPTDDQLNERTRFQNEIRDLRAVIAEDQGAIQTARQKWEKGLTADLNDRRLFPGVVSGVLRTPEVQRKETQAIALREFFLRTADHGNPKWKKWGQRINTLLSEQRANEEAIVEVMVMEENPPEKTRPTHLLFRGDYQQPRDEVQPGTPSFLPSLVELAKKNEGRASRLDLAQWLIHPQHPLTARVTINRIWQQFFGIGLVKTAEDFGVQGELPSHPHLLDWLAVEFIESGWDMKHMVALITTSATYRQSADFSAEKIDRDPENRLLARSSRFRLPAMLLRDQALAVGGLLMPKLGGVPVYPHQPEDLWSEFSFGKILYGHPDSPDHLYRRSLYTFWRRTVAPPNMFDSASRQVCTVKPSRTNTPLHALTLLNDVTYVEAAHGLAQRMIAEGGDTAAARLRFGFQLATGRLPDEVELEILQRSFQRGLSFFQAEPPAAEAYVRQGPAHLHTDAPAIEAAAYAKVAQVILNLDETLNRP